MRFTTEEREEGLSGRAGGDEDEVVGTVVCGFAVEVEDEDAPVAVSIDPQHLFVNASGKIPGFGQGLTRTRTSSIRPFPGLGR